MASISSSLVPATESGTHLIINYLGVSSPLADTMISTSTVPVSKAWRLRLLQAQCRAFGYFKIIVNSVTVAKSNSGPASENQEFMWSPFFVANAGENVEIWYNQGAGPIVDLSCFLFVTEINS